MDFSGWLRTWLHCFVYCCGALWIVLYIYLKGMDLCNHMWICVDFWISLDFGEFPGACGFRENLCGFLWKFVDVCGFLLIAVDIWECLWSFTDLCGSLYCVWISVDVCAFLWIYVSFCVLFMGTLCSLFNNNFPP